MEKMIIEIDLDGSVQITTQGIKGKRCKDVTRQLEATLGKTTSSMPTKEMTESETVKVKY